MVRWWPILIEQASTFESKPSEDCACCLHPRFVDFLSQVSLLSRLQRQHAQDMDLQSIEQGELVAHKSNVCSYWVGVVVNLPQAPGRHS